MSVSYRKLTIEDIDVAGKRVFLRADLNVPLENGKITNDRRIRASLPTIESLVGKGASVIVASHLGRPKGQVKPELSLKPVAERLGELLNHSVAFCSDCIGSEPEAKAQAMESSQIVLLENLRFHDEETKNDPEFAKSLASLADIYVNDAFGTAHRAHASTEGITHFIDTCVCGYLIEKELKYLGGALSDPERPLVAILGGAKVGSKIGVIKQFMNQVDTLFLGGGMTYPFLKAQGHEIGDSLFDEDSFAMAKDILAEAAQAKCKFLMPVDCLIADKFDAAAKTQVVDATAIPSGWMGMDIGPRTIEMVLAEIGRARTVVWNGPVGVFEMEPFQKGTRAIAEALAASDATSVLGGGETAMAAEEFGVDDKMSLVSTGGGASLVFMEGRVLPAIAALDDK